LGKLIGLSRGQIAKLEGRRDQPITPTSDRALRMFYALHLQKTATSAMISAYSTALAPPLSRSRVTT